MVFILSRERACVIGVLGFDEKFLVRCVVRVSSKYDVVECRVLVPKPTDEYAKVKSGDAWIRVSRVLGDYVGLNLHRVEVDPSDFWSIVSLARRYIFEKLHEGKVVVCFSGGVRVLGTALVIAALTVPGAFEQHNVEVCVEHEAHQGHTCFTPSQALAPLKLTDREFAIIQKLIELNEAGPSTLSRETRIPKATVWRILKKLVEDGIVEEIGKGKYRVAVKL